jgi:RHS repeat-associated protein
MNFELEYTIGSRQYELSNHLGNVLAVISDWKVPVISGASVISYSTVVVSSQDYSPFGVTLSGRSWSAGYRYGFNGMEKDNNTFDGAYDFGARILDVKLGRWFSIDNSFYNYPSFSPYNFVINNPLFFIDPDGNDPITGILEGLGSFAIDAGMQFLEGWLLRGESPEKAWDNVSLWTAAWSGIKTAVISSGSPIPGVGTASKLNAISKNRIGKLTMSLVENMTKEAMNRYHQGKYNDSDGGIIWSNLFDLTELEDIFWDALITSLVEHGFEKRAEEILKKFKSSFKNLQKQYDKLHKYDDKTPAKSVKDRIKKVDSASKEVLKGAGKGAANTAGKAATELGVKKGKSKYEEKKKKPKTRKTRCPHF